MQPIKARLKPQEFDLYPVSELTSAVSLPEVFEKARAKNHFKVLGGGGILVQTGMFPSCATNSDYVRVEKVFEEDGHYSVKRDVFSVVTAADFAANYEVLPE